MPWLLNLVYAVLVAALTPLLLYRRFRYGKYRFGWKEKLFGRLPERPPARDRLWFHAVSVGEVLLLRGLIADLRLHRPDAEIVLTTTTQTGHDVARSQYPDLLVCYCPLDFSWAVRRALRRLKPTALVLAELELWPNLILAASAAGVRLAIVNGRLSEKSARGYGRIRPFVSRLLARFETIAVQSEEYAERFRDLGAPPERLIVTGSVKYDGVRTDRGNPQTRELRRAFALGDDDLVFIAGSTQHPEEEYALATWRELVASIPNLRLILVPRHKERFEEVASLVRRSGLPLIRRSEIGGQKSNIGSPLPPHHHINSPERVPPVGIGSAESADGSRVVPLSLGKGAGEVGQPYGLNSSFQSDNPLLQGHDSERCAPHSLPPIRLLDTLGELGACWGLADVAFVGGSLTNRGGQNMIEPAAYGAAVLFGPNTRNFRDAVQLLLAADAASVVHTQAELTEAVRRLLVDAGLRSRKGASAQRAVAAHRGATVRTRDLLLRTLVGEPCRRAA
jgi:3-deoxy-D-manno-octulosonic-acid transferase